MKKKHIIILLLLVLVFILVFALFNRKDAKEKLENYITRIGFRQDNVGTLYYKQTSSLNLDEYTNKVNGKIDSEYSMLYFDVDGFQLIKDDRRYSNGISSSFNPVYDYRSGSITYKYRYNYNDTNIIIEGGYNKSTNYFVCNPTFTYEVDIDKAEKDICNSVKADLDNFRYEAFTLVTDAGLLREMQEYNN